jgi:ADP-ribose pyrophosphatase YjhB (NUDIX family)
MVPSKFTIRVYGILIHNNEVLLSLENIRGAHYLKFPGGGLEFGEGVLACLHREFREELDISIRVIKHFYTTEDYFSSAFSNEHQVLSLYYLVASDQVASITLGHPTEVEKLTKNEDQLVYWCKLKKLNPLEFPLPIDRIVAEKLLALATS